MGMGGVGHNQDGSATKKGGSGSLIYGRRKTAAFRKMTGGAKQALDAPHNRAYASGGHGTARVAARISERNAQPAAKDGQSGQHAKDWFEKGNTRQAYNDKRQKDRAATRTKKYDTGGGSFDSLHPRDPATGEFVSK